MEYTKLCKFDPVGYKEEIYNTKANRRRVARGFAPFIIDAVDKCLNNNHKIGYRAASILELGVSGAGSQMNWEKFSSARVYGVEYFHPDHYNFYIETNNNIMLKSYEKRVSAYKQAYEMLAAQSKSTRVIWGSDAYKSESVDKIKELNFNQPLDVIVDDAAPTHGSLLGLMAVWQNHITDTGIIISETPFGNGTDYVYDMPAEEKIQHCQTLASQGMICFNMEEYAEARDIEFPVYYLAFYAKDFNYYGDVLKKYEHNIVAGRENWK